MARRGLLMFIFKFRWVVSSSSKLPIAPQRAGGIEVLLDGAMNIDKGHARYMTSAIWNFVACLHWSAFLVQCCTFRAKLQNPRISALKTWFWAAGVPSPLLPLSSRIIFGAGKFKPPKRVVFLIGNSVLWWSNPCEIHWNSEGVGTYSSSTISRSGLEETELVGFVVSRFVKLVLLR